MEIEFCATGRILVTSFGLNNSDIFNFVSIFSLKLS